MYHINKLVSSHEQTNSLKYTLSKLCVIPWLGQNTILRPGFGLIGEESV